ncbi:MAG: glycosyltransferase family 4 protein [Fluviibacter sp.]
MKLAIARQRYNPYGGAERFVDGALNALAQSGAVDITLLTRAWDEASPTSNTRRVEIVNPAYRALPFGRVNRDRSFAEAVGQIIRENRFDLVQAHERIPGCHIFRAGDGIHAAWLRHRQVDKPTLSSWWQRFDPYHAYTVEAERTMFAHANLRAVICNSHMVADEIHAEYGVTAEKLHVIYNGVDLQRFSRQKLVTHRDSIRNQFAIPLDVPLILYVGSGYQRKGVAPLLKAMAQPELRASGAWLAVVGADKHLDRYKQLAENLKVADRVVFAGAHKDVAPWYGAADVFALPTQYDPCPNAALEALAAGLPTLTSPTCGVAELIASPLAGAVVSPQDPPAMSAALLQLLENSRQPQAGEAARACVAQLSWGAMSGQLQALYATLVT